MNRRSKIEELCSRVHINTDLKLLSYETYKERIDAVDEYVDNTYKQTTSLPTILLVGVISLFLISEGIISYQEDILKSLLFGVAAILLIMGKLKTINNGLHFLYMMRRNHFSNIVEQNTIEALLSSEKYNEEERQEEYMNIMQFKIDTWKAIRDYRDKGETADE